MKGRRKADLQTLDLFAAPDDGDTVIITTGSRTGEVWRYKASTTSWSQMKASPE